jgi:hypothetical protein
VKRAFYFSKQKDLFRIMCENFVNRDFAGNPTGRCSVIPPVGYLKVLSSENKGGSTMICIDRHCSSIAALGSHAFFVCRHLAFSINLCPGSSV